jgi:ABC-2 type transport system permease protein
MRRALKIIWAFLVRDAIMSVSYQLNFAFQVLGLFFTVFSLYFMSKLIGQQPLVAKYGGYLAFSVLGVSMTSFFSVGFTSFSNAIRNEQMMGTLEAVLMTPARLAFVIVSSSVWNFLWATMSAIITISAAGLLFHIRLQGNIPGAFLLLAMTTVSFACLGIISASFIMVFKRGDPLSYLVSTISLLLGGVLIPIDVLPGWLRTVSYLLPITHGLNGLREILLRGRPFMETLPQLGALAVFAAIGIPVSLFCFHKAVNIARREGSLLHY